MKKMAIALIVALGLLTAMPVTPTLGVSGWACRVKNTDTGVTKIGLQRAVKAARNRQHLTVRGVCHGTTRIGKNLTITGIRPGGAPKPTLDGDQKGTVVTVGRGRSVVLKRLTITDGSGTASGCLRAPGPTCGGGIWNHGRLTLVSVLVTANHATNGGGAFNLDAIGPRPKLTLLGTTRISDNSASELGGGIYGDIGTIILRGSSRIIDNLSATGGGVYNYLGTLILSGSSRIFSNAANAGGGVYNDDAGVLFGTVTLKDSSRISGNTATGQGGGVDNTGTLTLKDSSQITGNSASSGGGVHNVGTFDTNQCGPGKRVHDNVGGDCAS